MMYLSLNHVEVVSAIENMSYYHATSVKVNLWNFDNEDKCGDIGYDITVHVHYEDGSYKYFTYGEAGDDQAEAQKEADELVKYLTFAYGNIVKKVVHF